MDALSGTAGPKTLQLQGIIQGTPIKILVDSGSTNSFISEPIAQLLSDRPMQPVNVRVKVANGGVMQCSAVFPSSPWTMQGYSFAQDLRVLPLQAYDLVLGMDWLEKYSPMKVHWGNKWMLIPHQGASVLLQGIISSDPKELVVQLLSVQLQEPYSELDHLPPEIKGLLVDYAVVFSTPTELSPVRDCDHTIPLMPGARPVNVRPYRYPPALKDEIERQVAEMLQQGIIQPSSSPFCPPVLLVKKKDGTWRFCVDYRYLNALTVKGQYPIPIFEQLMDELSGASWFSILDLWAGYHQIRLKAGEEFKTAFQTHSGRFEFRVMAFGLTGGPGTFQGAMNTVLSPLLRKCVVVFFDDILVYSQTFKDHVVHLKHVLSLLAKGQWHVKLSKCNFAQRQVSYLGHVISEQGVATDVAKIEAILNWPPPSTVKELRSFLGLAGYYRRFVGHFAIISKPLADLLKKHSLFVWNEDQKVAFSTLQQALVSAPVLALPNFAKVFCIETDACQNGIGAVLLQDGHPLAFMSRPLGPKTEGLSTYEKEYLAILMVVDSGGLICFTKNSLYSLIKGA